MKSLEEKIRKEGKVYPGKVLKVGSFLNHQIDVPFMKEVGEEFYRLFADEKITKILTVETSGIAVACMTALFFDVPVVFGKKSRTANLSDSVYSTDVKSYTHGGTSTVIVEKQYLTPEDRILLIDDFLANGCALEGMMEICRQAGAQVVGAGIVIEKAFQDGGNRLRKSGLRIESLARVKDMDPENGITFID